MTAKKTEAFAEVINTWSDRVNAEIQERDRKVNGPEIDRYNEHVIMGLKISHSIMQDCFREVLAREVKA